MTSYGFVVTILAVIHEHVVQSQDFPSTKDETKFSFIVFDLFGFADSILLF